MIKKINIKPPFGVSFTQSIDGTITFNYTIDNAMILREILVESANKLFEELVNELEIKRAEEDARRQIPISRSQIIANELSRLKEETKIINPTEALMELFSDDLSPSKGKS